MLSLLGSIQPDPFSPLHTPAATRGKSTEASDAENKLVAEELLAGLSAQEDGDESDGSDNDGFQALGKKAGQASAEAARRKVDAEKAGQELKKSRKRKPEKSADSEKTGKKKKSSKR